MTNIIKSNLIVITLSVFLYTVASLTYGQEPVADKLFAQHLESIRVKYNLPALGAMQINDGVVTAVVTGYRVAGSSTKVNLHDSFHLGSCVKAMTATLIGIYVENGNLKFNSTLEELFPEYEIHEELKMVTVEMLLSHMSGISGRFRSLGFDKLGDQTLNIVKQRALLAKQILKSKPKSAPGIKFNYSSNGYIILGHILERIENSSWEEIISDDLFKPFGMSSCGFGPPKNQKMQHPTQPWPHKYSATGPEPIFPGNIALADNAPVFGPAGTVSCSLDDWSKFALLHLNSDEQTLLSKATMNKLHTVGNRASPEVKPYTYGAWVKIHYDWAKGDVLQHGGSNTMNFVRVWIAPEVKMILLVATNYAGSTVSGDFDASNASDEVLNLVINRN